jgi:hypothetical protein
MSIQDLKRAGDTFNNVNLSAGEARVRIVNLKAAEIQHLKLASRICAQTRSQSVTDYQRMKTEQRDFDRLREMAEQVRQAVRSALSDAMNGMEYSVTVCKLNLTNARHPWRECESMPLRSYIGKVDDERRRRDSVAQEGERCTLRANRITATATPEEFIAEVRRQTREKNLDDVGSMLEAAALRWKKLPPEIEALTKEIEETDFFRECALAAELEERVKCLNELRQMYTERPAIVTEEEIEGLKHGTAAPQSLTEAWLD